MKVYCHTNLDLHPMENWPKELPAIPNVGDEIRSDFTHRSGMQLRLQVVKIYWEPRDGVWTPTIELHMTKFQLGLPSKKIGAETGSITAFYEWYEAHSGMKFI